MNTWRTECASIWSHVSRLRRANGDVEGARRATQASKTLRGMSKVGNMKSIYTQPSMFR